MQYLLFLAISTLFTLMAMATEGPSKDIVKLLIVEDEKDTHKPVETRNLTEYYLEEHEENDDGHDYVLEEHRKDYDEIDQETARHVLLNVKVNKSPNPFDINENKSTKKIDVDVKINNHQEDRDDVNEQKPRKYNVNVKISKKPFEEHEDERRENAFVRFVKGAIKYTG